MADPAMAAARAVAERTNEVLHGLDPERPPAPLRHLIRNGSGSIGYRLGGSKRIETTVQRLTNEQADYIDRWIELYAIRPVGIPADGDPVELWEAQIVNTLRTWGTRRREERGTS